MTTFVNFSLHGSRDLMYGRQVFGIIKITPSLGHKLRGYDRRVTRLVPLKFARASLSRALLHRKKLLTDHASSRLHEHLFVALLLTVSIVAGIISRTRKNYFAKLFFQGGFVKFLLSALKYYYKNALTTFFFYSGSPKFSAHIYPEN